MPGVTEPTIGAGTTLLFDKTTPGTADTQIPGIRDAGDWGEESAFIDITPEDATTRSYIDDLPEPVEITIICDDMPGNADQLAFVTKAIARASITVKRQWSTNRIAECVLELGGFVMQKTEVAGNSQKFAVKARITGGITWSVAA